MQVILSRKTKEKKKENADKYKAKNNDPGQMRWLTPVIPATLEAEIGRITVQVAGQKPQDPI
jgi:hypothetical protein